MSFDFRSNEVLLDIDAICRKLGISRSTFERLRRSDNMPRSPSNPLREPDDFMGMPPFPAPTVNLGRSPRWSASVLNAWINGPRVSPVSMLKATAS